MIDRTEIEIRPDYVVIFGSRVDRPQRVTRWDWLCFWESVSGGPMPDYSVDIGYGRRVVR